MTPRQKLLLAIAAGVVLAGPPAAGFNLWLNTLVERQGQAELDLSAGRSMALAESRIARSIATLDGLASRGVDSCRASHLDALRQATFATTPIKELSVVAADGRTLCSDLGGVLDQRKVISSERVAADSDVLLEVVRIGDRQEPMVRLRRPGGGTANGLAAMVPSELFIARVSVRGGPLTNYSRMSTRGGTLIGEAGIPPEHAADAEDRISGTRNS